MRHAAIGRAASNWEYEIMSNSTKRIHWALASGVLSVGLFAGAGPAQAYNEFLKGFTDLYPGSTTAQAGCATCHGTSTSNLNAYGKDLCLGLNGSVPTDVKPYLQANEGLDSDGDATGSSNLVEINANAQPGWTVTNQLYATWSLQCAATGATVAPPSGVPLPYDPPTGGNPVAVAGGPYSGLVNIPIVFDGSGSFDSDGGTIVSYAWNFGDGGTAAFAISEHTYSVAGTYTVTLTVTDNDGKTNSNQTTATVSAGTALDLDIAALNISKSGRVGKAVSIKLSVENMGSVAGQAFANVVGRMNGVEVYGWRQNVFDDLGRGSTTFTFPSYTPTAKGTIDWTVTIDDGDPDMDFATATTVVK
jgi:hypothetical protein